MPCMSKCTCCISNTYSTGYLYKDVTQPENSIIYVNSKTGNDSNNGTFTLPLKTIPSALFKLQQQSGNIGTIQLLGTSEFVLPNNFTFDARLFENKFSRIIIKGTRLNQQTGTVFGITLDHGPNIDNIDFNALITGSSYKWQSFSSTLISGFYNEQFMENFTNGHVYTIKENTDTKISVLSNDPVSADSVLTLENGDSYELFTIINEIRFYGEFNIISNIKGFVEFNSVKLIPNDENSQLISPIGPPLLSLLCCEILINFANISSGKSILPGSKIFEGCKITNTTTSLSILKNDDTFNTEYICFISCILTKTRGFYGGFTDMVNVWAKDCSFVMNGFNSLQTCLIENSDNIVGTVMEGRIGRLECYFVEFKDTRPASGSGLINISGGHSTQILLSKLETTKNMFLYGRESQMSITNCTMILNGTFGSFLKTSQGSNIHINFCNMQSTSTTSSQPLYLAINSRLTFARNSITRMSPSQSILLFRNLTQCYIENLTVIDVGVPTSTGIILESGSRASGININTINGNQIKVGGNVAGILQSQNDFSLAPGTTQNCSWS